jgi:acetyl esterase
MRAVLDWYVRQNIPDVTKLPIQEARPLSDRIAEHWREPRPGPLDVADFSIAGPAGALGLRLYRPQVDGRLPVLFFLHGGGWTFCNLDTHDRLMRLMAIQAGAAVLGVAYRLAPEAPFPAALEDADAALAWLSEAGSALALDPRRIVYGGDSAGANLALGLLLRRRDSKAALPLGAALFYGCFGPEFDTQSHRRNGGGAYNLTTERMRWFWNNYLGGSGTTPHLHAAPLRAELRGLPPIYLNAAEFDCLLDDSVILAERLAAAGVRCRFDRYDGVIHGFLQMSREVSIARQAIADAARWVRATFSA